MEILGGQHLFLHHLLVLPNMLNAKKGDSLSKSYLPLFVKRILLYRLNSTTSTPRAGTVVWSLSSIGSSVRTLRPSLSVEAISA